MKTHTHTHDTEKSLIHKKFIYSIWFFGISSVWFGSVRKTIQAYTYDLVYDIESKKKSEALRQVYSMMKQQQQRKTGRFKCNACYIQLKQITSAYSRGKGKWLSTWKPNVNNQCDRSQSVRPICAICMCVCVCMFMCETGFKRFLSLCSSFFAFVFCLPVFKGPKK